MCKYEYEEYSTHIRVVLSSIGTEYVYEFINPSVLPLKNYQRILNDACVTQAKTQIEIQGHWSQI